MTSVAGYILDRSTPKVLAHWFAVRAAIYLAAVATSIVVFLIGGAVYVHFVPAPAPTIAPVPKPTPPAPAPIIVPAPSPPSQYGEVLVRLPPRVSPAFPRPETPQFDEIARLVVGIQILDSNNVLIGSVDRTELNRQGQKEVVVGLVGTMQGFLTLPVDSIVWKRAANGNPTRGTIPYSIVDIHKRVDEATASQNSGQSSPVSNPVAPYVTVLPNK